MICNARNVKVPHNGKASRKFVGYLIVYALMPQPLVNIMFEFLLR